MLPIHERFLEKALAVLQQDQRILGLLAGGSMISGMMDEFSDLDLVVVYDPHHREDIMSQRLTSSTAVYPSPDPQWIKDRFWVWVHYAATKLGRGELFEFIDMLGSMRHAVLGPLILAEKGRQPNGTRRLEQYAADLLPELKETVAAHDVESCCSAMQAAIRLYRRLRLPPGQVVHRESAERTATAYLDAVYRSLTPGR